MIIYIGMLLLSILLTYLFKNNVKLTFCKIMLAMMPFFIISAIRFDVGTDYLFRYLPDYFYLYKGIEVNNIEFGFKLLYYICFILFDKNFQVFFIITSFIICLLIFLSIYKFSKNAILSIIIFFFAGLYFQSMNIIRQFIAMSVLLFFHNLILEKKYFKWILICLCASLIHRTAILGVFYILLSKINKIDIKFVLFFAIVYLFFSDYIEKFLNWILKYTSFSVYLVNEYNRGEMVKTTVIVNLLIYIYMYYIYLIKRKRNNISLENKLYLNLQAMAVFMSVLGNEMFLFFRIVYYFEIFQIISIPNFTKELKIKDNQKICSILITICFLIVFTKNNIINNDNEVLPYHTIFETKYVNKEISK